MIVKEWLEVKEIDKIPKDNKKPSVKILNKIYLGVCIKVSCFVLLRYLTSLRVLYTCVVITLLILYQN